MRRTIGLMVLMLLPAALNADQDKVVGYWAGPSSIFEVAREDETLTGTIRALLHPNYLPDESTGRTGEPRTDSNNPDESLQNQPLIGLSMFSEYEWKDGQWQGKIYDPESGNVYQSRMSLNKKGELEIRGYIGMPMFGRTSTFTPVSECTPQIVPMLAQISAENLCESARTP